MRLLTYLFALMLVMGISFGGASIITSQPVMAEEGETAGGEMTDEAEGNKEGAEEATDESTESAEGEIPGGEMTDDAQK